MGWSVRCGHKWKHRRGSGKQKFIIFTGPKNRKHTRPCRAPWGSLRVAGWSGGRKQEQGGLARAFIGVSTGKARQGKINSSKIG